MRTKTKPILLGLPPPILSGAACSVSLAKDQGGQNSLNLNFSMVGSSQARQSRASSTVNFLVNAEPLAWSASGSIKRNDREMTNLCRGARSVPTSIEMNADLPSLDQLRSNAAECIRLAEAARTSQHKSLFIEMADRWLTLAEHAAREDRLNGGSLFRDR
jgi:hypothetical protein